MSKLPIEHLVTVCIGAVIITLLGVGIPSCVHAEIRRDEQRLECVKRIERAIDCRALFP
jgi:hypothetical protein